MSDLSSDLASLRINREEPSGSGGGKLKTLVWLLLSAVAIGAGYVVVLPAVEARLYRTEVGVTEIAKVSPAQSSVDLTATGYVVAERIAKIGVQVAGRVNKVHVKEGQRVEAGQPLFTIDVLDQSVAYQSSRARAAAVEARAQAAKAQADEIRLQLERDHPLAASGVATRASVDDLAARLRSADETAKAALAEARAAQADARTTSSTLRHGTVVAPISGTVVGRPPEMGDVLVQGALPSFELVDLGSLVVEADVPEGRLSLAKQGAPTEIVLDVSPTVRSRGEVLQITPRVNRSKATIAVKVKFIDVPPLLLPEMSARVSFLTKALDAEAMKAPPKIVVPGSALAERGGDKVVFVVDGTKARLQRVTLGPPFGDGFELVEGPAPGTRVVKTPPAVLVDGKTIVERNGG